MTGMTRTAPRTPETHSIESFSANNHIYTANDLLDGAHAMLNSGDKPVPTDIAYAHTLSAMAAVHVSLATYIRANEDRSL